MATSMQRLRVSAFLSRFFPVLSGPRALNRPARPVLAFPRSNRVRAFLIVAIASLPVGISAPAQQFSQGFQGAARQGGSSSPAESNAYAAAVSQPNPAVRASAIQQFLIQYPNSPLRQQAIAQMMTAKRQSGSGAPAPAVMNPAMNAPMNPAKPLQPASAPVAMPAAAPVPQAFTPRQSLLQEAPKPAQVTTAPHSLTIKADNSTLSQILHEISGSTGMKVEGLGQDQRIFGTYGPGEPRVVLLSLLEGSGYNVVMIGDTTGGAPRELSLTQRTSASTNQASASVARNTSQEDDEEDVQQAPPEPPQPVAQPVPGNPQGPEPTQPRTPQEIQQEMMRLRQQQQQGQQPPQPQQQ
jgi:hypothetical protein